MTLTLGADTRFMGRSGAIDLLNICSKFDEKPFIGNEDMTADQLTHDLCSNLSSQKETLTLNLGHRPTV